MRAGMNYIPLDSHLDTGKLIETLHRREVDKTGACEGFSMQR